MIPEQLHIKLSFAEANLRKNPRGDLAPIYRQQIYAAIGSMPSAVHIRSHLGFLTIYPLLPIWRDVYPDNPLPYQLLETAEAFASGAIARTTAEQLANARNYVEDCEFQQSRLSEQKPLRKAQAVVLGAVATLFETLGMGLFNGINNVEELSNDDLDP